MDPLQPRQFSAHQCATDRTAGDRLGVHPRGRFPSHRAQLGLVLGFVGSRVLGQFEIFTEDDPRLLLVAPNIVEIERQLQVKPRDFRLWVCVHEQTHRIQFAAAPWLTGYLLENIHEYMGLSDMSTGELFGRLAGAVRAVRSGDEPDGVIGALQSPEQKQVFDRLTAVMSLLEDTPTS